MRMLTEPPADELLYCSGCNTYDVPVVQVDHFDVSKTTGRILHHRICEKCVGIYLTASELPLGKERRCGPKLKWKSKRFNAGDTEEKCVLVGAVVVGPMVAVWKTTDYVACICLPCIVRMAKVFAPDPEPTIPRLGDTLT